MENLSRFFHLIPGKGTPLAKRLDVSQRSCGCCGVYERNSCFCQESRAPIPKLLFQLINLGLIFIYTIFEGINLLK
jgi:hypothetical protein